MAYITTQEVKNVRELLKRVFPNYKFSVSGEVMKFYIAVIAGAFTLQVIFWSVYFIMH